MESLPVELAGIIFRMLVAPSIDRRPPRPRYIRRQYNERKQLLAPCTLVSRKWREIAQPYLFEDIRFTLCDKSLQEVYDFFSYSAHIRDSVRKLQLVVHDYRSNSDGPMTTSVAPSCGRSIGLFVDTLRLFPHLLHLRLEDVFYPHAVGAELVHVQEAGFTIDSLEICSKLTDLTHDSSTLQEILACFSRVSRLRVEGAGIMSDSHGVQEGPSVPHVQEMELVNTRCTHRLLRMFRTPGLSIGKCQLHRLDIEHISDSWTEFFPALQSVIDHAGPRLTHLRCNMVLRSILEQFDTFLPVQHFDLSACANLHSLTLGFQLPTSKPSSTVIWSTIMATLAHLERQPSFPPLQTLNLEVESLNDIDFDIQEKLTALGVHGAESLFLRLCRRVGLHGIVFRSPPYVDRLYSSAYRASLSLCFPTLRSKGFLHYQERGFKALGNIEVI